MNLKQLRISSYFIFLYSTLTNSFKSNAIIFHLLLYSHEIKLNRMKSIYRYLLLFVYYFKFLIKNSKIDDELFKTFYY